MTFKSRISLVLSMWVLFPVVAMAGELAEKERDPAEPLPNRVQLVHAGSLVGWNHSSTPASGWTVEGTKLTAGKGSTPLVAGWTFEDFALEFLFSAAKDAALQLTLLDVPQGDGLRLVLKQGEGCGQIFDGGKLLAKGQTLKGTNGLTHRVKVDRSGQQLTLSINGELVSSAKIDAERRFGLSLEAKHGNVSVDKLAATLPLGESIFNGKDLAGWWSQRKQDAWTAEDGHLVASGKGGNYLRSEKLYGNYTLAFEYKMKKGGNSGVGIRTPREGWPSRQGMELQILDRDGQSKGSQMSIYQHFPPLARPDKSEAWNHVVIQASGRMITAWVNGQLAQHANTATNKKLAAAPLEGWVGFQDHGASIQIRHIYLAAAPAGSGLGQWYAGLASPNDPRSAKPRPPAP